MPETAYRLYSGIPTSARLVILLTALLLCLLTALATGRILHTRLSEDATHYLNRIDTIMAESQHMLVYLNNQPEHLCDEQQLLRMRTLLLSSQYIRNIHYAPAPHWQCSATEGKTPRLQPLPEPAFHAAGRSEIWLNQTLTLHSQLTATLIRQGNYWLTIVPDLLADTPANHASWQLLSIAWQKPVHVAGKSGLLTTLSYPVKPSSHITFSYYQYQQCSVTSGFCLAMRYNYLSLLLRHPAPATLAGITILLLSYLVFYLCRRSSYHRLSLGYRLRSGLNSNCFSVVFQPVINLHTHQLVGCEVLARFRDQFGIVSPLHFIPELSRQQLTIEFTLLIARQALQQLHSLQPLPDNFHLALNVYPEDIANGKVLRLLSLPLLEQSGIKLVLEITEQQQLVYQQAQQHLASLKAAGIQIAIDDFGTGYSNLSNLKTLKADYLKIDKSFVQDMEADSIKSSLIPKIREIAQLLHYQIIAEGIENQSQAELLVKQGITLGQGWYFAKPMPVTELHSWLQQHSLTIPNPTTSRYTAQSSVH